MLAALGLLAYRILCLLGYGCTVYFVFKTRPPRVSLEENIIFQTRFLTIDTLLVQILYFALAILLMPTKCYKLKSALSCFALTTATVVSVMTWGLYFYDRELLMTKETFEAIPTWFMQVSHSLVSATAIFDILISRPKSVPFIRSLLLVVLYYLGYAAYTEYLIYKEKYYVYPLMRIFSDVERYQFYGAVLVGIFLVFLVSVYVIRFSSIETKRKSKKEKVKSKKPQQQQLSQQARKHSPAANANAKNRKKQNKQE
ncbi:unnamed protein product [Hymenolepis diminuta]|uniref:Endoplasmic reticulum retention receptor n=1 Tax=Hymenolepis diminuta TaxID=6216 RepID=A0A0R3SDB8_HYMDI|nr:unnamed protein product [Hymenolepis diminuta]